MPRPPFREVPLDPPSEWLGIDVRLLRRHLGVSQATFARILGVERHVVTGWERDHRHPPGACCRLLDILKSHPEAFGEGVRA